MLPTLFAALRRTDSVGEGVAGALEGAPHVPTGDGAVGAPTFTEGEKLFGCGHVLLAVRHGPAFLYAQVVDGENVRAAQIEDQKHLNGPGPDAADRDQALDQFFVGHFFGLLASRNDAVDCFLGEIFHGGNLGGREAGFAKGGLAELEHLLRAGRLVGAAESLDTAIDCGGGFAGNGLISNGFEERFEGGGGGGFVEGELNGSGDELGELLVLGGEVGHGGGEIERERRHGRGRVAQVGAKEKRN